MKINVEYQKRKSIESLVPNYTVKFNGMSMVVDEGKLPPKLYRMIPMAHGTKPASEWYGFCVLAVAMGLMK